jgi:hypothetical protein
MRDWEKKASRLWNYPVISNYFAAYDCLTHSQISIEAAKFLVNRREELAHRQLILTVQGNNYQDYINCLKAILEMATSQDVIGLGGWANLGLERSRLPQFLSVISQAVPLIASANLSKIHIWGVAWDVPLTHLLYQCDLHKIQLSTDTYSPLVPFNSGCCMPSILAKGAKANNWRENVALLQAKLATLRESYHYKILSQYQQMSLFSS